MLTELNREVTLMVAMAAMGVQLAPVAGRPRPWHPTMVLESTKCRWDSAVRNCNGRNTDPKPSVIKTSL